VLRESENPFHTFQVLLMDLCNAFERGALNNKELDLRGILTANQIIIPSAMLQRRICQTFPLEIVLSTDAVNELTRLRHIHQRDANYLKNSPFLYNVLKKRAVIRLAKMDPRCSLTHEPSESKSAEKNTWAHFITYNQGFFQEFDWLCAEFGLEPRNMPVDRLSGGYRERLRFFLNFCDPTWNGVLYTTRETFHELAKRGIPVQENDFTILRRCGTDNEGKVLFAPESFYFNKKKRKQEGMGRQEAKRRRSSISDSSDSSDSDASD